MKLNKKYPTTLFTILSIFILLNLITILSGCIDDTQDINTIKGKVNYVEKEYYNYCVLGVNNCYYTISGYAFDADYNELVYAYENNCTVIVSLRKSIHNNKHDYIKKVTILECD